MKIPGRSLGGLSPVKKFSDERRLRESESQGGGEAGSVRLSAEARALDAMNLSRSNDVRMELVQEAQELIAQGQLDTDENIDRAIDRLLFELL